MVVRGEVPFFFFFNDTATTEIYTLSLHDALPISWVKRASARDRPSSNASYSEWRMRARSMPTPLVEFAWGSASTSSVLRSAVASDAARFTAVVVLSTPPFWLAIALTRDIL